MHSALLVSALHLHTKEPFIYYVNTELGGWVQKMSIYAYYQKSHASPKKSAYIMYECSGP